MYDKYVRVAAATPKIRVADCKYNADRIIEIIDTANEGHVKILVFPELCITGYTCGDLFLQSVLLDSALEQMIRITKHTKEKDMIVIVGLPLNVYNKLYNVAAVLFEGQVLGFIPKMNVPNYNEFYEMRHFEAGKSGKAFVEINDKNIPFSSNIIFTCSNMRELIIGVEICEDLWVPNSPSLSHAIAGATVIANLSASDENIGKDDYRRQLLKMQSAKLLCGYIYSDAGEGESTSDLVFAAHNIIAENGTVLSESKLFENEMAVSEIDLERLVNDRKRMTTYKNSCLEDYIEVEFKFRKIENISITRNVDKTPFVPHDNKERQRRCEEIINIQSYGLKKRLEHTDCKNVVIGISGGLDSTLAMLVTVKAFELLGLDKSGIIAVTMPCFGTTQRTYTNACRLVETLGATLKEINITEAVNIHLRDIGHDNDIHDITYENSQARERTQILMDLANKYNGLVIGTGDLSELALGWATYNGDHMSMYAVNSSIPKTLVRYLVEYFAKHTDNAILNVALNDILDTPVSPELLPPKEGEISQKTEELVGPYELHDFFLYYMLRFGYSPSKIYRLAKSAFKGDYSPSIIYKWESIFYKRFFSQQFKRSCMPDGPKVGSIALSPRGDLRMPSDASYRLWMDDLQNIKEEEGI